MPFTVVGNATSLGIPRHSALNTLACFCGDLIVRVLAGGRRDGEMAVDACEPHNASRAADNGDARRQAFTRMAASRRRQHAGYSECFQL